MSNIFNPSTGGGAGGLTNINVSAGTTSNNLSNLVFSNSNGVTFGLNGSTVTASVGAAGGGLTNINVSAGTTSNNLSNVVFSNSNGLAFGLNGSTVTGSYTVPSTVGLLSAVNVSAGTTSNNLSALTFNNANGITFGLNASTVTASHNGLTSQSNQAVSAANGSFTFQTLSVADSNGVSWSTGTQGLFATVKTDYLTSQSNQALSGSNGSFAFQTATFGNLNGLSFYTSNGSMVGSYTVPTQSTQPVALSGSNGSFNFSTATFGNSNGLSFYTTNGSMVGSYTVPSTAGLLSAINVSAGTTSNNLSALTFNNANGITFGLNGSALTASHNGLTTARASNDAIGLNTAQTNVTWTVNSSGLSLNAAGYAGTGTSATNASITLNSNGLAISVAAPGGGGGTLSVYANSNTTQSSSGTIPSSSLIFAGAGIASVGVTNGSVVVSVPAGGGAGDGGVFAGVSTFGNTGGSTGTVSTGNFVLVGSNNITLSQSTGAAGSAATVSILGPASSSLVGWRGVEISTAGSTISVGNEMESYWANAPYYLVSSTAGQTQTVGQSTSVVFPAMMGNNVSIDFARFIKSISCPSTSFASTGNTSYSYNYAETHNLVVYSRGTGASSLSLQSIGSTSFSLGQSIRCSQNTTNNISVTHGYTFPIFSGTSSTSFSYAATNSSMQVSSTHLTIMTGAKQFEFPFGTSFAPGQRYFAYGISTAQTTQQTAALSAARIVQSHFVLVQPNLAVGDFGAVNNASVMMQDGIGSFTTNAIATTASLGFSNISSSASHAVPYLQMVRIA